MADIQLAPAEALNIISLQLKVETLPALLQTFMAAMSKMAQLLIYPIIL